MKIPTTLLLSYQEEFELNKDLTIEDLCTKYSIQPKQLKGYTKWKKRDIQPIEIIKPTKKELTPKEQIDKFKKLALANAIRFMEDDIKFAEVKEFKDIVNIVDTIEKSYKSDNPVNNNINVVIQNLINKYSSNE